MSTGKGSITLDIEPDRRKATQEIDLNCFGYANNIIIMARGKVEGTHCELLQSGITITKRWCSLVVLSINPIKTTLVTFTKIVKIPSLRTISLDEV